NKTLIDTGLNLRIKIESPQGTIRTTGKVIELGSRSFRIKCDRIFHKSEFETGQDVILHPKDNKGLLPLKSKFIRLAGVNSPIIVLGLPDGEWLRNRRSFVRAKVELNITVIRDNGTKRSGTTSNVSGSGALIETEKVLNVNEKITIIFEMPDDVQEVSTEAIVRREIKNSSGAFKYGIEFTDILNKDQDNICRLVLLKELESRRVAHKPLF
ncbi:MAG: PilZ domain-containing protein, partial [Deltaproteobacteria bacterium]|nr:PilZ domain-containing protein [Deltaproteobacteria bacterium]